MGLQKGCLVAHTGLVICSVIRCFYVQSSHFLLLSNLSIRTQITF